MPALTIHLPEAARLALEDLAEIECRSPGIKPRFSSSRASGLPR